MKRVVSFCAAAVAIAAAAPAHAFEFGTPASQHPYNSPQNFALEVRVSPYHPAVDDAPELHGHPFADSFGTNARFYIGLELDWQTFRIPHVGTIGPGVSVGTVSMSRPATTITGQPSGDEYSLTIYPFTGNAVLRADVLWRDLPFPIVPYGKFGLGYALWRASNTGGTASTGGISGKGSTWGTNAALGAAFALDVLDPGASVNMDNSTGINNTYFFFEYYWLNLSGIGQSNPLYVGSSSWAAGLAFEF